MRIIDIPKESTLRWEWVKYQLRLKGYTLTGLGKEIGVTKDAVKLTKNVSYPKMQKAIADRLVMLPQEIWPERYGKDGRPIKHSPRYPRPEKYHK
ncbi:helix-turn-helix domain-containing protein [Geomonas propionica]|uniref:Helix-turn-helix domain-containing protein n=1 Tax=Geomonas propionica TaxID=2798582 RepID=A0ABS0YQJ1_9BACT|nr:helix-turn-helix domain-containing protein [Geomonas propionica]